MKKSYCLVAAALCLHHLVLGQTLTHGPVVGGVTDATANVFLRTS